MKNIAVMPNYSDKNDYCPEFVNNCTQAWINWANKNECEFIQLTQPVVDFKALNYVNSNTQS